MNERKRFDINNQKQIILERDNFMCQNCGRPAVYLAHRIAQTGFNIKKYGEDIIHNRLNLVSVCDDPRCNDVYNIGFNSGKCKKLVEFIKTNKQPIYDISIIDKILE